MVIPQGHQIKYILSTFRMMFLNRHSLHPVTFWNIMAGIVAGIKGEVGRKEG